VRARRLLNFARSRADFASHPPTGQITRSLRHVASEMSRGRKDAAPIPLWVTGHSLGSALASLIYARYLRMASDLGEGIQLRDCYTFGSELRSRSACFSAIITDLELSTAPRLGDGTFVSKYEEVSSQKKTLTDLGSPFTVHLHASGSPQHLLEDRQPLGHRLPDPSVRFYPSRRHIRTTADPFPPPAASPTTS
jgi:hypothetical protein